MTYLKGKDLIYKGHTLECWHSSIPSTIIYKTNKPESISYIPEDGIVWHKPSAKKPEGFEKF